MIDGKRESFRHLDINERTTFFADAAAEPPEAPPAAAGFEAGALPLDGGALISSRAQTSYKVGN